MAQSDHPADKTSIQDRVRISLVSLIFPLLNTLAVLATLGILYYSKVVYKRAPITEEGERNRLTRQHQSPPSEAPSVWMNFDPITVNIAPTVNPPSPHPSTRPSSNPLYGKLHYLTLAFTLEVRDPKQMPLLENLKPTLLDQVISIVGRKQFHELNTVQGRYVLQSQILDFVNQKISSMQEENDPDEVVTHVYLTQFIVQ